MKKVLCCDLQRLCSSLVTAQRDGEERGASVGLGHALFRAKACASWGPLHIYLLCWFGGVGQDGDTISIHL